MELKKELESKRLYFRPFRESDAPSVFEYSKDSETVKYLTWEPHKSVDQSLFGIINYLSKNGAYAIVLKENNKLIGSIDLRIIDSDSASFGYVINKKYWNKGYMSEALYRMFEYLFDEVGIKQIIGCHESANIASGKVMMKCGMKWSHLVKNEEINHKIADYDHYIIKKEDWIKK